MNTDSIKNYHPTGMLVKQYKPNYGLENRRKSTSADLCDIKNINRGYYSGSFTGTNVAAVAGSMTPKGSKLLDNILTLCDKHTVIAQNLVALVLAAGLRPIAIMSLPGKKDKEDKIYASGHSMASGLIGFGFSSIVMYPLGIAVEKTKNSIKDVAESLKLLKTEGANLTKEQLEKIEYFKKKYQVSDLKELENHKFFKKFKEIYKVKDLSEFEHSKAFKNVTKMLDMAPDVFIFGVLKAMLTVALIPPILKYVFGIEKKKKPPVEQQAAVNNNTPNNIPPTMEKPEIAKFAGGLK